MINSTDLDPANIRLKRLHFRSHHRGNKEMDIVLGRFAEQKISELSPELLLLYEQLLAEDDADIWQWLIGNGTPTPYQDLLEIIKSAA